MAVGIGAQVVARGDGLRVVDVLFGQHPIDRVGKHGDLLLVAGRVMVITV